MNPFKNIDPGFGLLKDTNSSFSGRYRLNFDQATPFRELSFGRVFIKVNRDAVEHVQNIYHSFPKHLKYEIRLFNQKEIRGDEYLEIDCFEDEDWFLSLDMMGDVVFIPMYNFYFALKSLSSYLEDCHFFIYSSGDLDDRWMDEYQIANGKLEFSRNIMETEAFFGAIIHYLKKAVDLNTSEFSKFATFQVYTFFFDDKYAYRELGEDGKEYDEFGEEITDDINEYVQFMTAKELTAIKDALNTLFNLDLDNNLKNELNKLFSFHLLDWKRAETKK